MKYSILIATKNRRNDLLQTLHKSKHLFNESLTCVVCDDGSTDGTYEEIKINFPQIKLYRNEVSRGYLYCRNKMLNETEADFAISLDDDANFLTENPIEIIENYFYENQQCGVIAARIYWNEKEPQNNFTTAKPQIVQSFVGCGHVWRIKAWKDIPNYPEWYQFYGEENFASMQLFKKGWKVHYVPQLLVHHRVNLKSRGLNNIDTLMRYKNALRADWLNYLIFLPLIKIPQRFAYSVWMQLKNKVFKGNFKILRPLFQAKLDVLKNIPKVIKNRNSFTEKEFKEYYKLTAAKIFWKPEN